MSFESVDRAAAWADANGGEDGLRVAIEDGRFGNNQRSVAYAREWLRQQEVARAQAVEQQERELRVREVRAAEASAETAQKSADEAKRSA